LIAQSVGRSALPKKLNRVIGGLATQQQDQGCDEAGAVPPGLATNQYALASDPVPVSGSGGVGKVVFVQVHFAVVKETQANFFDIPIDWTSPCIESDDGVEVFLRNCWFARAIAGDVGIIGAAHPQPRKNFTPEGLAEATSEVRVSEGFEFLGAQVCSVHDVDPFRGFVCVDVTIA
jgi:hypothetical protein